MQKFTLRRRQLAAAGVAPNAATVCDYELIIGATRVNGRERLQFRYITF